MRVFSGIMRSGLLDKDFELLAKSRNLACIVDDGIASDHDYLQGLFHSKKSLLATRLQDFLDCLAFLDRSDLRFRKRSINKGWGTTQRLLEMVEDSIGHPISHGALMLALDLRGMILETIPDQKDTYMTISNKSRFC
jgi:hypothetical protein